VEDDAEGLQQLTGYSGFELAGDGTLAFGKLVPEFVGLVTPTAPVGFGNNGDEPNPFCLADALGVQVVALEVLVGLRGIGAILGRLIYDILAKSAGDCKVESSR
jgi:hypothetical protein